MTREQLQVRLRKEIGTSDDQRLRFFPNWFFRLVYIVRMTIVGFILLVKLIFTTSLSYSKSESERIPRCVNEDDSKEEKNVVHGERV